MSGDGTGSGWGGGRCLGEGEDFGGGFDVHTYLCCSFAGATEHRLSLIHEFFKWPRHGDLQGIEGEELTLEQAFQVGFKLFQVWGARIGTTEGRDHEGRGL